MPSDQASPSAADLLGREFASRLAANGRYTLRAFARDAGVYPSKMSEILRGKVGVSGPRAKLIAKRLKWDTETAALFYQVAICQFSRSPQKRKDAETAIRKMCDGSKRQLSESEFRVLADWYHLAILSLAEILGGQVQADQVSNHLRITQSLAKAALTRLSDANLMEMRGEWFALKSNSTVVPGVRSSQAIRAFHGQMLEKARHALETQSNEERDNSAVILTMRKEDVPRAKELIRDFRKQFLQLISPVDNHKSDCVYGLSIQLFQIAQVTKRKTGE